MTTTEFDFFSVFGRDRDDAPPLTDLRNVTMHLIKDGTARGLALHVRFYQHFLSCPIDSSHAVYGCQGYFERDGDSTLLSVILSGILTSESGVKYVKVTPTDLLIYVQEGISSETIIEQIIVSAAGLGYNVGYASQLQAPVLQAPSYFPERLSAVGPKQKFERLNKRPWWDFLRP